MTTPVSGVAATTATPTTATSTTATSTTATSGTGSTAGTGTGSSATGTQSLLDPQAFLQLLVAQLQYQDPTNPTDTSTFMNQTAMLSQVQTMGSMSTTLTELMAAQQTQSATAMIGKQVTYTNDAGLPVTGVVGSASISGTTATLTVGGTSVPMSKVTTVALPTSA